MSTQKSRTGIRVDHITKTYNEGTDDSLTALDIDQLEIEQGEFLSIVGPSGCGKSTLLRVISGLTEITSGTVEVMDKEVTGPVQDVGFVFQSPTLLEWRTVLENVMFPSEALASSGSISEEKHYYRDRAHRLLGLTGLRGFEESYPNELSGGMQQRVAICRALLPDPSTLLMDEPFGALDEFTRRKLNAEMLDIFNNTEKTIVFVTHNIQEAVYLSDRVLVLTDRPGQVKEIVDIDIDRPRSTNIEETDEYQQYVSKVTSNIKAYI